MAAKKTNPPKHYTKPQKTKWTEIIERLKIVGTFNYVDLDLVESYVDAWTLYHTCRQKLTPEEPEVLVSPKTGASYTNPWSTEKAKAHNQMVKLSTLLGLNPIGRKRLKLENQKPVDPNDDFSGYIDE